MARYLTALSLPNVQYAHRYSGNSEKYKERIIMNYWLSKHHDIGICLGVLNCNRKLISRLFTIYIVLPSANCAIFDIRKSDLCLSLKEKSCQAVDLGIRFDPGVALMQHSCWPGVALMQHPCRPGVALMQHLGKFLKLSKTSKIGKKLNYLGKFLKINFFFIDSPGSLRGANLGGHGP